MNYGSALGRVRDAAALSRAYGRHMLNHSVYKEHPLAAALAPVRTHHLPGAVTSELAALRRSERNAEHVARVLERRGADFDEHEREVCHQLRAAGFLNRSAGL